MRNIPVFKDTRLLEALDYIDRDLIAEVINDIKAPDADEIPGQNKKAVWRSVKHTLLFAACLVLLGAVIPVVTYVSKNLDIFSGGIWGHSTSEATESHDNYTEQKSNAHYPMFTPDLEPISDDTVAELKAVWYKMVYDAEYEAYSKLYADFEGSEEDKVKFSAKAAETFATAYAELLFSPNKKDHFRGRYYGTIGDYVIFAINTYLEEEYNFITLGKTTILNDYSFYIFAYKDGVIKKVEDAYADGWLNATDAEKIKKRHNKFNAYGYWKVDEQKEYTYAKFVSDLEEITNKKIEQINKALFKKNYEKNFALWESDSLYNMMYNANRRIKEMYALDSYHFAKNAGYAFVINKEQTIEYFEKSFRYYGTFGNCIIWAKIENMIGAPLYDLDGLRFYVDEGYRINVYSNGKVYDLQEAFDNGILGIDNARKLYHRYLTYEAYLASDRTAPILAFSEKASADNIYNEAKSGGWVVFNGAFVTAGEEVWNEFYEKCSKGQTAAVNIVNYYPSRSAIFLTTIVYNRGRFEQYTEARSGGYTNFLYSKYTYIIKYDGEPLDKENAIHQREEVYVLVNDNTLTYPKIKNSTESINYYIAFTKISDIKDEYTNLIPAE